MLLKDLFCRFFRKNAPLEAIVLPKGEQNGRKAVHAHIYSMEVLADILQCICALGSDTDVYITTDSEAKIKFIKNSAELKCPEREIFYSFCENRGKDIIPFLRVMAPIAKNYSAVCHIHSKKATAGDSKALFRRYLLANLVRDEQTAMNAAALIENKNAGLIFADVSDFKLSHKGWENNRPIAKQLLKISGFKVKTTKDFEFPLGSMFWITPEVIERLACGAEELLADYNADDVCHATLRALPFAVKALGKDIVKIKYK